MELTPTLVQALKITYYFHKLIQPLTPCRLMTHLNNKTNKGCVFQG